MRRKMFLGIAALAIAVVSGYNVYQARTSTKGLSDLALANVEALAVKEGFPEDPFEGQGPKERYVRNVQYYYNYGISYSHTASDGVNYYNLAEQPVTSVSCSGMGNLQCHEADYPGMITTRKIDESEARRLGLK